MSRQSGSPEIKRKRYFVDEAGDPTLFGARGKVLVGSEGCSRYFALGLADVEDPLSLTADLTALRAQLVADPYFKDVPSGGLLPVGGTADLREARGSLPSAAVATVQSSLKFLPSVALNG